MQADSTIGVHTGLDQVVAGQGRMRGLERMNMGRGDDHDVAARRFTSTNPHGGIFEDQALGGLDP
jgi:hypothetical protein